MKEATVPPNPGMAPMMVPMTPDDPAIRGVTQARSQLLAWDKPFLCAFAPMDPLLGWAGRFWEERVPGAQGQPHTTIEQAGHYLQEDQGERLE